MAREAQPTLQALDPDTPAARPAHHHVRATTSRSAEAPPPASLDQTAVAEATLNLEPLRVPIATLVQSTLMAERDALARMSADLGSELDQLRAWRTREEELRLDQTALYRQAAEQWEAAGDRALALCDATDRLDGATQVLHAAVEAAVTRFWRRVLVAAWLLSLVGLGLVAGLCGVVWLALTHS